MKIACIGNMNNNNFALMRYLRDLGADAHLLLFENEFEHFLPTHDTWEIERWNLFIHKLPFGNNPRHVVSKSAKIIRDSLSGYTHIIGSGLAPAFAFKAGRSLDIFYPYCSGIEWVGVLPSQNKKFSLKYLFHRWIKRQQVFGISSAKNSTNLDFGDMTDQAFSEIGVEYLPIGVPMVYTGGTIKDLEPQELKDIVSRIQESDFVVISHARHEWRRSESPFSHFSDIWKRNDLLINAFSQYLKKAKSESPLLVMFAYGNDVDASKSLVEELGISKNVLWLNRMPRKWIARILEVATICVGEFTRNGVWGGTAWEGLAAGKPVMQSINFSSEFYQDKCGHDLPPFLGVNTVDDVLEHLINCENSPRDFSLLGQRGKEWFERYQGKELAGKYLRLLNK